MAENNLIIKCKNCSQEVHYLQESEKGMGYIECPKCKCSIDQEGNVLTRPAVTIVIQECINKSLEEHKSLHAFFEKENFDNYYDFQNYYDRHEKIVKNLESLNSYHQSSGDFLDDYYKFIRQEIIKDETIDMDEILENIKSIKLKDVFIYKSKNNNFIINATKDEFDKTHFLKLAVFKALRSIPRNYWGAFKFLPNQADSDDRIIERSVYELSCMRINDFNKTLGSVYMQNEDFIKASWALRKQKLKQAQSSFEDDSVALNNFFLQLFQDRYVINDANLISSDFSEKDFPVYVTKLINGVECEIHKDDANVVIYTNDGKEMQATQQLTDAIKELSVKQAVLTATLDMFDENKHETICHINDILYCEKDIHKINFFERKKILDTLNIKKSSFEALDTQYALNKSPYILCKKQSELKKAIELLAKIKDCCGVTIRTNMQYSLKYQQPGIFAYAFMQKDLKHSCGDGTVGRTINPTFMLCDFLNCEVKDVYKNVVRISGVESGNVFNAIQELTKKFTLIETRNFDGYEVPPIYKEIRLKKNMSRVFLIEGMRFYYDDIKSAPLVIEYSPSWGGYIIKFITHVNEQEFNSQLIKHIMLYAQENNFLRNEKFSVSGDFLDDQTVDWEDLKLSASVKDRLKKLESLIAKNDPSLDSRGLIFIGPPGCGKTLTGKLLSKMASTFIWVTAKDCSDMGPSYAFSEAFSLARCLRPTILFMEDIDSYIEYGMIDLLKTELDGMKLNNGVFTILTSNFPEKLPEALIDRPGRFHDIIQFALPDKEIRKEMVLHFLKDKIEDNILDSVLKQTEGFSGAHMKEICRFAQIIQKEDNLGIAQALLESLKKLLEQRKLINDLRNKNSI